MNDKLNGIILSSSDYKEADVLLKVLTKQHGIISLVGKASKKISSKNHFLNMCHYEFLLDYKENKTIFTIHNSKLLNNYFDDTDINLMSFKNILVEATLKNPEIDSYDQLLFVFNHINNENKYLLGSLFFSYLIKCFGIMPVVDHCALCKQQKVVAISSKQGGFLCEKHLMGEKIVEVERLKKYRMIIKANFEHYDILKQFTYDMNDFKLLVEFFMDNAGLNLKTYNFYERCVI